MSPRVRVLLLALASLLAVFGVMLTLAASLTPDAPVNPFQPDPESRTINLLSGAAALFAAVALFAATRREEAEVDGDSVGW